MCCDFFEPLNIPVIFVNEGSGNSFWFGVDSSSFSLPLSLSVSLTRAFAFGFAFGFAKKNNQ